MDEAQMIAALNEGLAGEFRVIIPDPTCADCATGRSGPRLVSIRSAWRAHTQASLVSRSIALLTAVLVGGVLQAQSTSGGSSPAELLGEFRDDYGNGFRVSDSAFVHLPRTRYRIVEWNVRERYVIAQNGSGNASDPGLWTRIDWITFSEMAPYTWGFCLTAYNAPSEAAARATPSADRATPRSGCNGSPFSRMRRPG